MNLSINLLKNGRVKKAFIGILRSYADKATIPTKPYKFHRLSEGPKGETILTKEEGLKYYKQMVTIRKIEMEAQILYRKKIVRGFLHLYIGQESCAVGIYSAMLPQDTMVGGYRIHGWMYLMSQDIICVLGELTGSKYGVSKGKGGSMHMYGTNMYGGNGIVAAQTPQGVGIALAHKYRNNGAISVIVYGDGAANQGQVFEAYNMAKIWNLPCLFLCENNQYAMGTSLRRAAGCSHFYKRGDYIPGIWIDATDVLTVREAARFARDYCLTKGPLVMELNTYRFVGHSMSDPDTSYRPRDEVQQKRKTNDPIKNLRDSMIKTELATAEELDKLTDQATKDVKEASQTVVKGQHLPVEDLTYDIYQNTIQKEVRGFDPWTTWKSDNRPQKEHPCRTETSKK